MFPALPSSRITGAHPAPRTLTRALPGAAAAGAAVLLATGCGFFAPGQNGDVPDSINLSSPLIQAGQPLPPAYTCDGEEGEDQAYSPPLSWSGLPENTESIALVVDDPEAAEVFWVLHDLDPQAGELRQNTVPGDARQGLNSAGEASYDPPCAQEGEVRQYRFTLYALDSPLGLPEGSELDAVLEGIADRAVARGSLSTTSE
ncbi:YbhB/YbcL family Raf kinase inhibitor-like protein [Nocardiopsis algeriensis]|uniref:YbhB/YbcL family Raf kinase inhibitor-like protein n=1 Tax=Nocardiopsis algeriensis TaxID=1478215 RepID=A0A841IND1_9ACTN|nr:YbhB/YbcL family Raf kinase inhibitor-like protein [Nocardiopsis algeriensis]MBB6119680.1 hypothetical protein [Nocardiopsis algeriensis]